MVHAPLRRVLGDMGGEDVKALYKAAKAQRGAGGSLVTPFILVRDTPFGAA